ncbi:MAG: hypothetical protein WC768_00760 [Patescibacteria group bacterium]|jgi:hypothetical protein
MMKMRIAVILLAVWLVGCATGSQQTTRLKAIPESGPNLTVQVLEGNKVVSSFSSADRVMLVVNDNDRQRQVCFVEPGNVDPNAPSYVMKPKDFEELSRYFKVVDFESFAKL